MSMGLLHWTRQPGTTSSRRELLHRRRRYRQGFSLIEAAGSTFMVGILLVAALKTVSGSLFAQSKAAEQVRGQLLARALMTEIVSQSYENPTTPVAFGLESGESGSTRVNYNDVDDYSGTESPPKNKDGTALSGFNGWQRTVAVNWVNLSDLTQVASGETGAKRIVISIQHNGATVCTVTAIRTK